MALDTHPLLGSDGLTAIERMRKTVRDALREQLPDSTDDEIWALTVAITDKATFFIPPPAVSLTYAWSDGHTYSHADRDAGLPDQARERSILRALLVHALRLLDERDNPLRPVPSPYSPES